MSEEAIFVDDGVSGAEFKADLLGGRPRPVLLGAIPYHVLHLAPDDGAMVELVPQHVPDAGLRPAPDARRGHVLRVATGPGRPVAASLRLECNALRIRAAAARPGRLALAGCSNACAGPRKFITTRWVS